MAGSIDDIKAVSVSLKEKHYSQASQRLASRIDAAIPRFEATDEKRRRREYRQIRKQQFTRPEPGFSLYEGRTRGKRMRYTFDDNDEDELDSDAPSTRRSGRNHSNGSTPVESGPTVTASGRTVRPRGGGMYGESLLSGQANGIEAGSYDASDMSDAPNGRAARAGRRGSNGHGADGTKKRKHNDNEMSDESDAEDSGNDWDGGDDFEDEKDDGHDSAADDDEEDRDMMLDEEEDDLVLPSLVVKLKVGKPSPSAASANDAPRALHDIEAKPPPSTSTTLSDAVSIQPPLKHEAASKSESRPEPDPMDVDSLEVKQLDHSPALEVSGNALDKSNSSEDPVTCSNLATNGLTLHPPVAQAQANGWS